MGSIALAGEAMRSLGKVQEYESQLRGINDSKEEIDSRISSLELETQGLDPDSAQIKALKKYMSKLRELADQLEKKRAIYTRRMELAQKRLENAERAYEQAVAREYQRA